MGVMRWRWGLVALLACVPLSGVAQEGEGDGVPGDEPAPVGEPAPMGEPMGEPAPAVEPMGEPAPVAEPAPAEPAPAPPEEDCPTFESCEPAILDALRAALEPESIEAAIRSAADEADPPGEEDQGGEQTAEYEAEGAPKDPPKVRKGEKADIVKQITRTEPVKTVIKALEKTALEKVKTDWKRLKAGEKVVVVAFAAPILASLFAVPGLASPVQTFLNQQVNQKIGERLPWLSVRADFVSANKVLELRVDVGALLRRAGVKW